MVGYLRKKNKSHQSGHFEKDIFTISALTLLVAGPDIRTDKLRPPHVSLSKGSSHKKKLWGDMLPSLMALKSKLLIIHEDSQSPLRKSLHQPKKITTLNKDIV